MVRRFVIDTDAGLDDASALFLATEAHKAGVIDIVAVTAVHGNTKVRNVLVNVARTLKAAGLNNIPIYEGTFVSLLEPQDNTDPFHGIDGFGDAVHDEEPDLRPLQAEHAVTALVRLVKENPGQITLVALGPLTNIAMAMRLDADFASNLKDMYIMGGNTDGVGNITVSAEFNFHCDPEAAFIVLNNIRCPTYIAPWELCLYKAAMDWEWRLNVYGGVESPQSRLMNLIEKQVISKRKFPKYIVCDQLAMAAAIDPSCIAQKSSHYVTVELNGKNTRGQMVVDRNGFLQRHPNVHLIDNIDMDLFKSMMIWSLGGDCTNYKPPMLE